MWIWSLIGELGTTGQAGGQNKTEQRPNLFSWSYESVSPSQGHGVGRAGCFGRLRGRMFPRLFWILEAPGIPCLLTFSFCYPHICFCHHIPRFLPWLSWVSPFTRTSVITRRSHLVNPWYASHFKILNLIASISPFCLTGWHIWFPGFRTWIPCDFIQPTTVHNHKCFKIAY